MFRLENVSKVYSRRGHEVIAFQSSGMQIAQGEYVAIVGPSGSGKTTLLSMLGGMLSPTSGRVVLGTTSLYEMTVSERTQIRRERIGFIFQTFNLVPYLTALENVQMPLYLSGLGVQEQKERAIALLERIGLGERLGHKPSELSTGQQQRVALARTLANDPPLILADEPTGNLDPNSRQCVLDFFDELHGQGRTIVMVTHDRAAAERAGRRIDLHEGSVGVVPQTLARRAA